MYTVSFYLRKPTGWEPGKRLALQCLISPLHIRKTTHEMLLPDNVKGKKIIKGEWDHEAQKVRSIHPAYLAINARLEKIRSDLDRFLREAELNSIPVTGEKVYEIINPVRAKMRQDKRAPKQQAESVLQVYEAWGKDYKAKLNLGNSSGKEKGGKYIRSYERLPFFLNEFQPGLPFEALTEKQTIEDFKKYMLTSTTKEDRTINKLLTGIRVLLDYKGQPKAHVEKLKNRSTTQYALTWAEVLQLRDADYPKAYQRAAADVFVIACQICLRYSDLYSPALDHLLDLSNGKHKAVNLNQGKTGDAIFIPFPATAAAVMERNGWVLPVSRSESAQAGTSTYNFHLRSAAEFAGLTRKVRITKVRGGHVTEEWKPLHEAISIHDARHTGATLVLEATGDMMLADALLGHAIASTYMHGNPVLIANKLLDAWGKIEDNKEAGT